MKVRKAEVCTDPSGSNELALFVHCVDNNGNDRFLLGSPQGNRWTYQEFPTPNVNNTMWNGGAPG